MLNGKAIRICLIVGLTKKYCIKMSQYFSKEYKPSGRNIKVELDLFQQNLFKRDYINLCL